MAMGTDQDEIWLTITEAARRLGVHVTTLRRWADDGEISVMFTAGGHRRFSASEVETFKRDQSRLKVMFGLEEIWAEAALSRTRLEVAKQGERVWLTSFTGGERERKRQMGRRMMGLLRQYVSLRGGGDEILEQVRAIGREHAEDALAIGLPSLDALRATMFFRDMALETALDLPDETNVRPEANLHILRRVNEILNAFQLAIAETYDQAVKV
jgi:excisionase family DNA binding protein